MKRIKASRSSLTSCIIDDDFMRDTLHLFSVDDSLASHLFLLANFSSEEVFLSKVAIRI